MTNRGGVELGKFLKGISAMNLKNYFNKISIIFILSFIVFFNILLNNIEASDRSDALSIVKTSDPDEACINKCNSLSKSNIKYSYEYAGLHRVLCSDIHKCGEKDDSDCNYKEAVCSDLTPPGGKGGILAELSYSRRFARGFCYSGDLDGCTAYQVYTSSCYLEDDSIRVDYPRLLSFGLDHCQEERGFIICGAHDTVMNALQRYCISKIEEFKNKCRSRCPSNYVLKIKGRKINTIGDLLDSVPATELLKVYDPNMTNY